MASLFRINQETGQAIGLFRRTSLAGKGIRIRSDIHVIAIHRSQKVCRHMGDATARSSESVLCPDLEASAGAAGLRS